LRMASAFTVSTTPTQSILEQQNSGIFSILCFATEPL
jgi:hypothetical protein